MQSEPIIRNNRIYTCSFSLTISLLLSSFRNLLNKYITMLEIGLVFIQYIFNTFPPIRLMAIPQLRQKHAKLGENALTSVGTRGKHLKQCRWTSPRRFSLHPEWYGSIGRELDMLWFILKNTDAPDWFTGTSASLGQQPRRFCQARLARLASPHESCHLPHSNCHWFRLGSVLGFHEHENHCICIFRRLWCS